MHILIGFLIIIFLFFIIGLSLIGSVIGFFLRIFGIRKRSAPHSSYRSQAQREPYEKPHTPSSSPKNKVFDDDEGEYVEFEEVEEKD